MKCERSEDTSGGMWHIATATVRQVIRLLDGSRLIYDDRDHYRFTMRPVEFDLTTGATIDLYGDGTYSLFGQHVVGVRINEGPLVEASA